MNNIEALLLGLIQGLTEFLPVSSSGHLVIAKTLFGIESKDATFEVVVHAATVLSTIVVFRKPLWAMIADVFRLKNTPNTQLALKILFSTLPVLVVGLFFKDWVEAFFTGGLTLVGAMLLVTALLLGLAQWLAKKRETKSHGLGFGDAFIMGLAQAVAVLPGLSRSGATIATGLSIGVEKSKVAPFSFMMVLIPVLGEMFLEIVGGGLSTASSGLQASVLLIGFASAFIIGLLACKLMLFIVQRIRLTWFAAYCALMGQACLIGQHVL